MSPSLPSSSAELDQRKLSTFAIPDRTELKGFQDIVPLAKKRKRNSGGLAVSSWPCGPSLQEWG